MLSKYNFRGIVGFDLKESNIKKFAKNVVDYINVNNLSKKILLAKDNRESGDYILSVVGSVFTSYGIEVDLIGEASTPMLVWLTSKFKYSLGVMITASHNLKEYNGLKVFNCYGESVDVSTISAKKRKLKKYVKMTDCSKMKDVYWRDLKNRLNTNKIKCVFDCANGAMVETVRKIFSKHQIIGDDKTGSCINDGYGTQDLANIKSVCKRNKKIGFAFDGDGDRVVAIDENGDVIDGDKILYILTAQKLGFGDRVVGTQISSMGLEVSLRRLGVTLIREQVGAKYVARRMKKECVVLGGENCGHIFLEKRISDAIAVVIELLNILNRTEMTFKQLLGGYKEIFRLSQDVLMQGDEDFKNFERFDNGVRVVVRKSMTENLIRLLVEGEDKVLVETVMSGIIAEIEGVAK